MELYDKNLKTLAAHYPGMDDLIEKAKKQLKYNLEIIEESSYEGESVLKINKDNRTCYLYGKRENREPAERWVKSMGKLYPNAPILMVGIGNVSYLEELIEKTDNKITIIIYEPSLQIFLYVLKHYDLERWMRKQLIIFWVEGIEGMESKNLEVMLKSVLKYEVLNLSRRLIVPNYDVLFREETLEFVKICRDIEMDQIVLRNTQKKFATVAPKNVLENLKYLEGAYTTIQYAGKIPSGIPGIVVAAGPSLNKNIKELKRAKGKAFIVATDTAIKPLLREGIVPDLLVIVDGKKPLSLFEAEGVEQIPLLSTMVAASEVLEFHTGKKIFYDEGFGFVREIMNHSGIAYASIPAGGSVATCAFSFLYMIGVKTIILVGQDLAYTNNRSHADGTFHEEMPEVDTSKFIMVEGNYEEKVPTSDDFKIYLEWYEKYIKGFQGENPDFRVINATEGGAKIAGTEIMTLKEALQDTCKEDIDIQQIMDEIPSMFDEQGKKWVRDYTHSIPQKCAALEVNAKKAVALYKKLDKLCNRRNIDTKEYLNLLKKIRKSVSSIEEDVVYDLIKDTLSDAQFIMKNEQFMEFGTMQEEGKEIARKGMLYMDLVGQCAKTFEEYANSIYGMEE